MTRPDPPQRLVVRLPNWLGDAVMALPALTAVRAGFPQASLTLAGLSSIVPVFQEPTDVRPHGVLTVEKKSEAATLRDGKYDAELLLTNSFRTAWNAKRAGIPERWGYGASLRGPLLTRRVARPRTELHQSEYYLELVRGLGIDAASALPRIRVSESTRARARRVYEEAGVPDSAVIIGFAPGAAYGHAKRWPPDRVAQVVVRAARERQARCVLVGAAADRDAGREIESRLPPDVRVTNLIGRTDLRLLIGVLERCRAFVSNDSGAMHLAAAVGVPVTAIFGPTNEKATAPLGDHDVILRQVFCRPCMLRDCPIDHRCMKRIDADSVFAAVARRLAAPHIANDAEFKL
jgi:heptosyltransferase-2